MSNVELFIQRYHRIPEGMLNDEVIKRESIMDELYRLCNHLEMHFDVVYNFGNSTADFINVEQSSNGFSHRVYIDGDLSERVCELIELHIKDDPQCKFVKNSHPYIEITTSNMIRKTLGIPLYSVVEDIAQEAAWQIGNSEFKQRQAELKKFEKDGVLKNYVSSYIECYSNADDMTIRKEVSARSQLFRLIEKVATVVQSKYDCTIDIPSVSEWMNDFKTVSGNNHGALVAIPFIVNDDNAPEVCLTIYESLLPAHRNLIINQFNRTICIFPSTEFADNCGLTRWNVLAPDSHKFSTECARVYRKSISSSHPDNVLYSASRISTNPTVLYTRGKKFIILAGTVFAGYQLLSGSCNIPQFIKDCADKVREHKMKGTTIIDHDIVHSIK